MPDNLYEPIDEDVYIAPGVAEKVLADALAKNRRLKTCEPYPCPTCSMITDHPPYGSGCRNCFELGNYTSEPFWICSRAMGWLSNTPADLIDVLTTPVQLSARTLQDGTVVPEDQHPRSRSEVELVSIAQTPEGQDTLAALWDKATRYCAHNMVSKQVQIENPRLSEGFEFSRTWVELPEDQKVYATRPRPKTRKEHLADAQKQAQFYELDKVRREQAARSAAISVLENSLAEARKLGIDVEDIV